MGGGRAKALVVADTVRDGWWGGEVASRSSGALVGGGRVQNVPPGSMV